jgi:ribosomal protein S18 acetylase RimI-like enzyme
MRSLLVEIERLEGPQVYCHLGDLDWWRFTEVDPEAAVADARLWFDGAGALVAFAWPKDEQVDMITHPSHRAVEPEMLTWAEDDYRARVASEEREPFSAWAYPRDLTREALLTGRGYEQGEDVLILNVRALDIPPPSPDLPPGYHIRSIQGEEDVAARVAVHRSAFHPSRMTVEKHRRVMAAPSYQRDLDLVVVAPDETFAAFCIVWYDAANRLGEFEPVGCHADYRRRGLARAVLFEGMRRIIALGGRTAVVFSGGREQDAPARALYDAAGFQQAARLQSWTRTLA